MKEQYYGQAPRVLATNLEVDLVKDKVEMCFYQYLPIKMAGALESFKIPENLAWIKRFVQFLEFDPHTDYVYVSVKHLFVTPDNMGNRPGWHSDGFGSDDVNYIWSDKFPTQFCIQPFELTEDHTESLKQLQAQAREENIAEFDINSFVRIDRWNIHRPPVEGTGFRTFLKFSVSKNKYNLQGNSHNYLMDYDWDMVPRSEVRNHPTADIAGKVETAMQGALKMASVIAEVKNAQKPAQDDEPAGYRNIVDQISAEREPSTVSSMKIVRHYPGFVDHDDHGEHEEVPFETYQQLLDVDFVRRAAEADGFFRFSIANMTSLRQFQDGDNVRPLEELYYFHLMQELDEGYVSWVIGRIEGTMDQLLSLELPTWQRKDRPAEEAPQPVRNALLNTPPPPVDALVQSGVMEFVTRDPLTGKKL